MALTFAALFAPLQLAATVGDIYNMPTAPATTVLKNGRVRLSNTSTSSVAVVTLYSVPTGRAADDSTCCLPSASIAASAYLDIDIPTMAAGGKLRGQAVGGAVTVHELGGVIFS